jgi:hypothetical protein
MIRAGEVLAMLIPDGGWVISGEKYEGIQWLEATPISKEEFEAGFAKLKALKEKQEAEAKAKKDAILERLGITEDEAKLLLA